MLDTAALTAFVATTDARRAMAFYRDTLGLRLVSDEPVALVFDANGTRVRVQKIQTLTPQPFTILGWWVSNIRETVSKLAARGVAFERYPWAQQDSLGIWLAPSGASVAWFKDPDGNILSLTEDAH